MPFLNYSQPYKCRAITGNKCAHQLLNQLMTLGQGWECRCSRERKDHHHPVIYTSPQPPNYMAGSFVYNNELGRVRPFVTLISVQIWTTKRIIAKRDKKLSRKYYKVLCQPPLDYSWGIIKKSLHAFFLSIVLCVKLCFLSWWQE